MIAAAVEARLELLVSRLSPQAREKSAHSPDVIAFHLEDSFVIKRRIVPAIGTYKMVSLVEPSSRLLDLIAALYVQAAELE